nr:hypothetical protein [Tanacetum cinerariifolium]
AVLETHARRLEWQRQAADDLVVQHIMRTQALEAGARDDTLEDTGDHCTKQITYVSRLYMEWIQIMARTRRGQTPPPTNPNNPNNPNNMTPEAVQTMIDQALLRISDGEDGSHSSHAENPRNMHTARPCYYADFMHVSYFGGVTDSYLCCNRFFRLNASYRSLNHDRGSDSSEESVKKSWGKESSNESGLKFIPRFDSSFVEFVQPVFSFPTSDWGNIIRRTASFSVSLWLPLIANSFAVSEMVIAEPRVGATTRSAATWVHHPWDRNFEEYQGSDESDDVVLIVGEVAFYDDVALQDDQWNYDMENIFLYIILGGVKYTDVALADDDVDVVLIMGEVAFFDDVALWDD